MRILEIKKNNNNNINSLRELKVDSTHLKILINFKIDQ